MESQKQYISGGWQLIPSVFPVNGPELSCPPMACYTFSPVDRYYNNMTSNQTGQNYTPTLKLVGNCAQVDITIGNNLMGSYNVASSENMLQSYGGVNNGPVKVENQACCQ